MNFNFELILFYAIVVCGLISLFDFLFLAKKRKRAFAAHPNKTSESSPKLPILVDYARSFFPVLLLVFFLRAFLFEPFRIPTGSLKPTLAVGDFIIANKFHYGIRLPVTHTKVFALNEPKRGDIILFRWPPNPSVSFIKRVIGVPGDRISYMDKTLYINGEKIPQEYVKNVSDEDGEGNARGVEEKIENLFGVKHAIYQNPSRVSDDMTDIVVPEGMYFAMGDNRDDSADSRVWGFVPEENIIGRANYIWMSWDGLHDTVRWKRIGKSIH